MRTPPLIYIDIPALRPGTVGAYAFAFVCAAFATALRIAIDHYVEGVPYITFFPAVIIATLVSGYGAGFFCLLLSVVAATYFLLEPRFSFDIENWSDVLGTLLFVLITFAIVIVIGGMRFAIARHKEIDRQLERRHKEVDRELEQHRVTLHEREDRLAEVDRELERHRMTLHEREDRFAEVDRELERHRVALRDREDRLTTVIAELQHRTRNLLTVVSTVADNTMRKSNTLDDFAASYRGRLQALARVQSLLFRQQRGGRVTFDELIEAELAPHLVDGGDGGQVTLDGARGIGLLSGTVQTLAMVVHELATNAIKYGALKQPNGHLTIRWHQEAAEERGEPWLHVDWKETGVEVPTSAGGTGQGRELIERALPYQFGARTTFALEPDGIHCTILLPLSEEH